MNFGSARLLPRFGDNNLKTENVQRESVNSTLFSSSRKIYISFLKASVIHFMLILNVTYPFKD